MQRLLLLLSFVSIFLFIPKATCATPAASQQKVNPSSPDVAITDIRFYAWYYDSQAEEVRYQEVKSFPVMDDGNEFPSFDIVITVKNNGVEHINDAVLKVTLAYKIGPLNKERPGEEPEQSYERAKQKAKWHKPEWAKRLSVPSLVSGESYKIRAACVPIDEDRQRYWNKAQWPYRARIDAFIKAVPGEQNKADNAMQKQLEIDMLD